jgi:hypothetical protein
VSVADRMNAFLRRRADALLNRANLAAMRQGLLPAGWVYGLNDQRQAEFDEQRRILIELHKYLFREYLFREPVTGPDGVAVAIWYEGTNAGSQLSFVVQAHAMSGPPAAVIRGFLRRQDAGAFAAQLAQQVRASGVEALRQDV